VLQNIIYNQVTTIQGCIEVKIRGYVLRRDEKFYILILAYKSITSHISLTDSGRMAISLVSCTFDTDNMYFVDTEHYNAG
jgi:hypothetical protein